LTIFCKTVQPTKGGIVRSNFSGERMALPRVHPFPRTFLTASGKGLKACGCE
jgi:hypothetical protein